MEVHNAHLSPRLLASLFAIGFVLSAVLGATFMIPGRDDPNFQAPTETGAISYSVSFELRVLNPAEISLAEETEVLDRLERAVSEQFPRVGVTNKQTSEGYLIEVAGTVGESANSKGLTPLFTEIESFAAEYVASNYRAQLVFDTPFNFSFVEAVEAVEGETLSPARLITGGAFGVALFSLIVVAVMIVVEGGKISKSGGLKKDP